MTTEFLIAYRKRADTDINAVLSDALAKVLEDNLNEFDSEEVADMLHLKHERLGGEFEDEDGIRSQHALVGFSLDLPDDTEQLQTVIVEFAAALPETNPVFHAVKFEDPVLRAELAAYAERIFELEMKLRRVLTLIYLYANPDPADCFNLLRDELVQPLAKERIRPEQMRKAAENQFFHLTFSQYVSLNQRPELKLPALLTVVRNAETYGAFRAELERSPIRHEDDAVLVAGLKERMDAIETMRNCVAHNRRPTRSVIENYENARPLLDNMLNEYLARWEITGVIDPGNIE